MKGKIRRSISLLLVLAMAMSLLGGNAWAVEAAEADSAAPVAETSEPAEPTDSAEQEEPAQDPAEPVQEPEKEEQAAEEPAQEEEQPVQEQSEPTQEEASPVTMEDSGTCGENLTWKLEGTTLTISGSGDMEDYSYESEAPWYSKYYETVVIEDNVTRIGSRAFSNSAYVSEKSVTIPDSVTSVGEEAFYKVKDVYITDVAAWCKIQFDSRISNSYTLHLNGEQVVDLVIPDGVTTIGDYVFCGCSGLISITIPDSVTSIGAYAFARCSNLTSVEIPPDVRSISDGVFSECSNLTSVTIPDGVTSIGKSAFYECVQMPEITIPDSVTSIGEYAFFRCKSLTSFEIPAGVVNIETRTFYGCDSLTGIKIPNSVIEIGNDAFENSGLTSVTIPDSVEKIGYGAFENSKLVSVTLPNGLKKLTCNMFYCCSDLTSVVLPDSITSVESRVFANCASLKSITIPEGVKNIPFETFARCTNLTSVVFPANIESLEEGAFEDCVNLKSLTFKGNLPSSDVSFENCTSLDEIRIPDWSVWSKNGGYRGLKLTAYTLKEYNLYVNDELVTNVVIPSDVTDISNEIFCGCKSLTSVTISDHVKNIGYRAFAECKNLTEVKLNNKLSEIQGGAFSGCSSLASIKIPDSVTKIGGSVFLGCSSLVSIEIPDSVTELGGGAFQRCSNLTDISLPDGVTSIREATFWMCSSLVSIKLPNKLNSIENYAFWGCSSLTSITIPDSVASIGEEAFRECYDLKSVKLPAKLRMLDVFTFKECTSLSSVTIPDTVLVFDPSAFSDCTNLADITIGSGAQMPLWIGLNGYSALKSISVAKDNKYYCDDNGVLYNKKKTELLCYPRCKEGEQYVVPDGVTYINKDAFKNCNNLTALTIPDSVISIGEGALSGCSNLKNITYKGSEVDWKGIYDDADNELEGVTFQYGKANPEGKGLFECTVTLESNSKIYTTTGEKPVYVVEYDGTEHKPAVTVEDGEKLLVCGTDYEVDYVDNINAGTGKVIVRGIGDYTGRVTKTFDIEQASQKITASISQSSIQVGKTAQITAKAENDIFYTSSDNNIAEVSSSGVVTGKAVGTANIYVWAKPSENYYRGKQTISVTVTTSSSSSSSGAKTGISSCQVSLNKSTYTYNGKAIEPTVTVEDLTKVQAGQPDGPVVMASGKVLKKGKDYTVSYSDNVNAGKAKVTVTGKGNYTGKKTMTFTIQKAKNTITASKISKKASTKAQTVSLNAKAKGGAKLTYRSDNKGVTVSKAGKVTLAKKFVGTATITVTAQETKNYKAATKKITFTVKLPAVKLSSAKSAEPGKLTVKWAKNVFATGYQVQYATSSKFTGAKTAKISKYQTVTSTLSGLTEGKKYYVRVRAYKTSGKTTVYSAWSSAKSATVMVTPKPAAVKLSSVKSAKAGEMTVKWAKNGKIDGYQVQYALKENFKGAKTVTVKKASTTSTTIKKLTKDKKYYVRVRTYQKVGSKTYYSAWSASKNVTIKK